MRGAGMVSPGNNSMYKRRSVALKKITIQTWRIAISAMVIAQALSSRLLCARSSRSRGAPLCAINLANMRRASTLSRALRYLSVSHLADQRRDE